MCVVYYAVEGKTNTEGTIILKKKPTLSAEETRLVLITIGRDSHEVKELVSILVRMAIPEEKFWISFGKL